MSAKYIHTIADENPDLHKQLGCMSGIFQIFNRQHFVTDRRISGYSKKRLIPGESGNSGKKLNITMQNGTEKNRTEGRKERDRTSLESSRSSFSSSSCSSTFTSIDSNKLAQSDPAVLGQSPLSKTRSQLPKKQPTPYSDQQSPDIRYIVKSSIQRESYDLSIKTKTKPEVKTRVMKHIDSPRPQQIVKTVSPRVSTADKPSRPAKEAPRFSYDERESRDKWKSVGKVRELPRFSLDSRESSIKKAASEPRSKSLLDDLEQRSDQRLSSVVAKLMGLETFPRPLENLETPSSTKLDENKHNQVPSSPRLTPNSTSSPKLRNIYPSKPKSPKFPLEPAPWKQLNGNQESQNSGMESQIKPQIMYPSVYGQIEKRLTEIEFQKSGKDLRALKQILEAMQKAGENIEDKKNDSSYKLNDCQSTDTTITTIKRSDSPKKMETLISISRSAKALQRPKISASTTLPMEGVPNLRKLRTRDNSDAKRDTIPRKNQFRESSQQSLRLMDKKGTVATYRSSKQTSVSPRLQHNKQGVEKQFNPTTQTSEANTPKGVVNRHNTEAFSPTRRSKPKLRVLRNRDNDQLSDISSEARCSSNQGDALSVCSGNDEVTSNYRSDVTRSLDEFKQKLGTAPATFEQPSPVSVLDTSFYAEGSPSPVKKISNAFADHLNLSSDDAVDLVNSLNMTRPDLVQKFGEKSENHGYMNDELRVVDSNDDADAVADSITSLCQSTDPMERYVAEILSSSGLLKDLGPSSIFTQLNGSDCLINPNLFQILEQARSRIEVEENEHSNVKMNQPKLQDKISRKLIFDTTDEILVNILISASFSDPWISPNKIGLKCLTGKKLFEKICFGMNDLRTNLEHSLAYEDDAFPLEISGVVLDVERLIFKDLISEIVSGEAGLSSWSNRHRRQLFTN